MKLIRQLIGITVQLGPEGQLGMWLVFVLMTLDVTKSRAFFWSELTIGGPDLHEEIPLSSHRLIGEQILQEFRDFAGLFDHGFVVAYHGTLFNGDVEMVSDMVEEAADRQQSIPFRPVGIRLGSIAGSVACDNSIAIEGTEYPSKGSLGALLRSITSHQDLFLFKYLEQLLLGHFQSKACEQFAFPWFEALHVWDDFLGEDWRWHWLMPLTVMEMDTPGLIRGRYVYWHGLGW